MSNTSIKQKSILAITLISFFLSTTSCKSKKVNSQSMETPQEVKQQDTIPQRAADEGQEERERAERPSAEERLARKKEQMMQIYDRLGLSDDQKNEMEAIDLEFMERMQSLRMESEGDKQAMQERMKSLQSEKTGRIKAILSEEQFQLYQDAMEEMRQRRPQRPH